MKLMKILKKSEGVAKQVIGQTILADLASKGIPTANKTDIETVNELIKFHEKNPKLTTYDALLNAFIENTQKSEAK